MQPIEQLEQLIHPDRCPKFESLRLPYCLKTPARWIFATAFPHLKICHLYVINSQRIVLPSSTINTIQALRQLTMRERSAAELETILLLRPHLSYLDFSCHKALLLFIHLNSMYPSLERLLLSRLQHFVFRDGEFYFLLSLFPNLTHFDLIVNQCHVYNEAIDFTHI